MARIRTIKPEFWTNERVMECSLTARLLFIGMWNFADDLGRLALAPKTLKAQIFPSDDINSESILGMIDELSRNGLALLYEVDGRKYLQITGWQHQRIDKPQAGKHPGPVNGFSKSVPGMVATEGKGKEWKGKEGNSEPIGSGAEAPPDPSVPEREYFARGRDVLGSEAGGLIAKILKAKGGNVALARAVLEQASQKQNPREYAAAACRGPPPTRPLTEHQRAQQETKDILDDLDHFARGSGRRGKEDPRLLSDHSSERSEGLRGGTGEAVIDLPSSGYRSSH